ncbi:hypothetical protein QO003_000036 [Arthrobacter silviterrae]|uniref:Helix-turn-helix transcriptional regulator n=1 Tax=Arthrobacter silviterrae TaxID=2026658 RepID=A0ABX0DCT4_9MICC|nr:helix-turn-helix transcriptional regulator [Arthrobacter silviterrae]MDQ0275733.1 hypothetical protein [Arthrobacter silviterrae]NGN83169.1 helix-turn-helix transcriptional regulator [Arthrobacter silviterrae]
MNSTRSLEQVIGENVRRLRGQESQTDFGQRLGLILGKAWSAQVVSAAETGKRSFIAAEMVALCKVLSCTFRDLYRAGGTWKVDITPDLRLSPAELQGMTSGIEQPTTRQFFVEIGEQLAASKSKIIRAVSDLGMALETQDPIINRLRNLDDTGRDLSAPTFADPETASSDGAEVWSDDEVEAVAEEFKAWSRRTATVGDAPRHLSGATQPRKVPPTLEEELHAWPDGVALSEDTLERLRHQVISDPNWRDGFGGDELDGDEDDEQGQGTNSTAPASRTETIEDAIREMQGGAPLSPEQLERLKYRAVADPDSNDDPNNDVK